MPFKVKAYNPDEQHVADAIQALSEFYEEEMETRNLTAREAMQREQERVNQLHAQRRNSRIDYDQPMDDGFYPSAVSQSLIENGNLINSQYNATVSVSSNAEHPLYIDMEPGSAYRSYEWSEVVVSEPVTVGHWYSVENGLEVEYPSNFVEPEGPIMDDWSEWALPRFRFSEDRIAEVREREITESLVQHEGAAWGT